METHNAKGTNSNLQYHSMGKPMNSKALIIALPISTFGLGFYLAPKEQLAKEVKESGFLRVETSEVLAATVESLRAENRLFVWGYKATATVQATRKDWWLFEGTQTLIVPAVVRYELDLGKLTLSKVTYDDRAKLVTVRLPKLELGDIAFQPEQATTINGGILTYSDGTVEGLSKLNYRQARRALTAQAQQTTNIATAQRQAIENTQAYFEIPLRIAGRNEVRVIAKFEESK